MSCSFKTSSQLKENIKCAYLATNLPSFISIQTMVLIFTRHLFGRSGYFHPRLKIFAIKNHYHQLTQPVRNLGAYFK